MFHLGPVRLTVAPSFLHVPTLVCGASLILTAIARIAGATPAWILAALSGLIVAAEIGLHEFAHAGAMLAFGARPVKIGLIGHPLASYDYQPLPRRKRVIVALAGTGVSAAALLVVVAALTTSAAGVVLALLPMEVSLIAAVVVGLVGPRGDLQLALVVDRRTPPLRERRRCSKQES